MAAHTLAKQAEWLKKYTNYPITIEGKCDERGTREYNLALGERRANAARQYLVAQGVPADRIKTISYGKERPEVRSAPTRPPGRATVVAHHRRSSKGPQPGRNGFRDAGPRDRRFRLEAGRPCLKMAAFELRHCRPP